MVYSAREGKNVFINGGALDRLADLVGMLPAVAFSPADYVLTAGGPDERRRFLNNALSQARPAYLSDILKYRRALRQRNVLLQQLRVGRRTSSELLDSWNVELAQLGGRVTWHRARFLTQFATYMRDAASRIEAIGEAPGMRYEPFSGFEARMTEEEAVDRLLGELTRKRRLEIERGRTMSGPHLDEVRFYLSDFEVRRYASQGQHRTFGLALKLALYLYLSDHREEPPILLLDDVFGDLDERRTRIFLELLTGDLVTQSIITAADAVRFEQILSFDITANRSVRVRDGSILAETSHTDIA
jgi:DNA replication and repair protein RecF